MSVFVVLCISVYVAMFVHTRSLVDTLGSFSYTTDWYGNFVEMKDRSLGWDLILSSYFVYDEGQWWRLFTASVVHLGLMHLVLNIVLIVLLGREIEKTYGSIAMACIIVAGAAGGAMACLFFQPDSPMGGASTVAYAMCAVLVAVMLQRKLSMVGSVVLIMVNLGMSLTLPDVSLWAHIGGLVAGLILAAILFDRKASRRKGLVASGVTSHTVTLRTLCTVLATAIIAVAAVIIGVGGYFPLGAVLS